MSEATHLCLDCERALRDGFTSLRPDGSCERCSSKAVLDLAVLTRSVSARAKPPGGSSLSTDAARRNADASSTDVEAKLDEVVRETSSSRADALASQRREREQRYLRARNEFAEPVRAFLIRNKLDSLNQWWDGWSSTVYTSIYAPRDGANAPEPDEAEFVELRLANLRGGSQTVKFYFDPEDEAWKVLGELTPAKPSRKTI